MENNILQNNLENLNIKLEKVNSSEWQKFREIRLKSLQTDPKAFGGVFENESKENENYWKERFENPERCFYAARNKNDFVAIAGSKKIEHDNWMIMAVYTVPEFRGKNISEKLIDLISQEVKQKGATKVSLMVNIEQQTAISLYNKLGFKIIKIEKDQKMGDGNIYDEYYMEKEI